MSRFTADVPHFRTEAGESQPARISATSRLLNCCVKSRVLRNKMAAIDLYLFRVSLTEGPVTEIAPKTSLLGPKTGGAMDVVLESLSPSLIANP